MQRTDNKDAARDAGAIKCMVEDADLDSDTFGQFLGPISVHFIGSHDGLADIIEEAR